MLVSVLHQLMQEFNIVFEDSRTVWNALHHYCSAAAGNAVDFADALILEKAKYIAGIKAEAFDGLYTFDRDFQQFMDTKKP